MMFHPAERDAERLRAILVTLAEAAPGMTLEEAMPIITASEKKTMELEVPRIETLTGKKQLVILKDTTPATGAQYVSIRAEIIDMIEDGKTINAIKEFRAETGWGLKESKDAVEHYRTYGGTPIGPSSSTPSLPRWMTSFNVADMSRWIDTETEITDLLNDWQMDMAAGKYSSAKIQAIKDVRAKHPGRPGLKEAKDAVEHWISGNPVV